MLQVFNFETLPVQLRSVDAGMKEEAGLLG